jgi:hypothetical protein
MILLLALNLMTLPQDGQVITINPDDVVSLVAPHRGFDPKLKCIINLIDGKHIAVGMSCDDVRQKLVK